MKADHSLLTFGETIFARQPLRLVKGLISRYVAYPIAESKEERSVSPKIAELRRYYALPATMRRRMAIERLRDTLFFAQENVPYYKDLFRSVNFDPNSVIADPRRMEVIPFLTKDIIREQGDRLLSKSLSTLRHHVCKTGGSTGLSCVIYYDQEAADYSSAVTLYARERIGKFPHLPELHFACRFPGDPIPTWPSREDFKCFAMNRSNIFFDRLDDAGLEEMWQTLLRRRPYLAHAHPSTIYALACYVEKAYGSARAFKVFESSGELLEPHARKTITRALKCRVINRYGLAEFGVMAYELDGEEGGLQLLESEGWPETRRTHNSVEGGDELVLTAFRNRLMPLIRYTTGDMASVRDRSDAFFLENVVGRIHDVVPIDGVPHATHHIQDILDHRVRGIQEFQIDLRALKPILRLVLEASATEVETLAKLKAFWGDAFEYEFVNHDKLVLVGRRAKFRHVVTA